MASQAGILKRRNAVAGVALVLALSPAAAARAASPGGGDVDALLSSDVSVIVGLEVAPFVESPLYGWFKAELPAGDTQKLDALKDDIGLDLEHDVDSVVGAVGAPGGERELFLATASGRFDPYRLGRALELASGVSWRPFGGTTLYLFEGGSDPASLAFRSEHALLFGRRSDVERVLGGPTDGEEPEPASEALLRALSDVPSGADFWWVGDERFLARLPWASKQAGEKGLRLPPLKSAILSGEFGAALTLELLLEAGDSAAARQLGDALRGLIALGTLQAPQPELRRLLTSTRVSADGLRVKLESKIEYAWLQALKRKPAAAGKPGPVPLPESAGSGDDAPQ